MQQGQKYLIEELFDYLGREASNNSAAHGFWDDYHEARERLDSSQHDKYDVDVKLSKIALMMGELGEAVEGIRKPHADEHCPEFTSEEVELADVLIRVFDYASVFGLRLGPALTAKMAYNQGRPYMHAKAA